MPAELYNTLYIFFSPLYVFFFLPFALTVSRNNISYDDDREKLIYECVPATSRGQIEYARAGLTGARVRALVAATATYIIEIFIPLANSPPDRRIIIITV